MTPLRVALIGCGFIGRRHLENVAAAQRRRAARHGRYSRRRGARIMPGVQRPLPHDPAGANFRRRRDRRRHYLHASRLAYPVGVASRGRRQAHPAGKAHGVDRWGVPADRRGSEPGGGRADRELQVPLRSRRSQGEGNYPQTHRHARPVEHGNDARRAFGCATRCEAVD